MTSLATPTLSPDPASAWRGGSGTPLLFLHGFEGPAATAGFREALAERYSVVAPTHPGYDGSGDLEEIEGVLDLVLQYRQFIEREFEGPVDVLGHSLGGMFAAEIAAICPQVVRRLVLAAPFGLWLDEQPIPDLFVMSPGNLQRALWSDPEGPVAQAALSALGNGRSGPEAIVARAMNLSAAGKFLWPIPDRGLSNRLPFVKAPALVVMGADDGLVPAAYGDAFANLIPQCTVEVIAGAGHLPMLEQPEAFTAAVSAFLAS